MNLGKINCSHTSPNLNACKCEEERERNENLSIHFVIKGHCKTLGISAVFEELHY